jgi:hypothetical protein
VEGINELINWKPNKRIGSERRRTSCLLNCLSCAQNSCTSATLRRADDKKKLELFDLNKIKEELFEM